MKVIAWAVFSTLIFAAPVLRADLVNGIKAVVHDAVITYEEVESLTAQTASVLNRQYSGQPDVLEKKRDQMRSENLEKLVDRQLILHDFKTSGYNLPESILDDLVRESIQADFHGDQVTMAKTLQQQGITREKYRQQIRERFIIGALRQKNISSEIIVSPHKVQAFYEEHRDQFKVEDEVKLRMIVLNQRQDSNAPDPRKLAEELLAQLKAGAAFQELATLYTQASDRQRKEGGAWGWVDKSVLRKELSAVAFTLKAGDYSDVIETPEAYYLMLVEETRPNHYKPLAEVREQIERDFVTQERARLEKQWMDKLKRKTFWRYF